MRNGEVAWWFALFFAGLDKAIASKHEGVRLFGWITAAFTSWHLMNGVLNDLRPAEADEKTSLPDRKTILPVLPQERPRDHCSIN